MRFGLRMVVGGAMLALAVAAWAGDTVSFGQRVVSVGDSVGRLREAAGNPTRVVVLQNRFGAVVGERWEFYLGRKTVLVTVSQGRVVAIDEVF